MKRIRTLLPHVSFALLAVSVLAGCQPGAIPIKTLLDNSAMYNQKVVRISGTVEEAAGVLGFGVYRVNDGTGTLTVVTKTSGAPRTGAKIGAEGKFQAAFTLGTESIAVVVERARFEPTP